MKCTFDAKKFAYFLFFSHLFKVTSIEKATCLFLNIELFANSRGELSTTTHTKVPIIRPVLINVRGLFFRTVRIIGRAVQ